MSDKRVNLDFYAKVKTDVGEVKTVINNIKNQLNDLKLPANATKDFEKTFENIASEIQNFEAISQNGINTLADTKKIDASWKKINNLFGNLGIQLKGLGEIEEQIFPKQVIANIDKANKALNAYQAKINSIRETEAYKNKLKEKNDMAVEANRKASKWQSKQEAVRDKETEVQSKRDVWNQNKAAEYQQQQKEIARITGLIDEQNDKLEKQKAIQDQLYEKGITTKEGEVRKSHRDSIKNTEATITTSEKELEQAKKNLALAQEIEKKAKKAKSTAKGKETKLSKKESADSSKLKAATEAKVKAEKEWNAAQAETLAKTEEVARIEAKLQESHNNLSKLQEDKDLAEQTGRNIAAINEETKALETSKRAAETAASSNKNYKESLDKNEQELKDQKAALETYEKAMNEAKTKADQLGKELNQMELDGSKAEWNEIVEVIKKFTGIDLSGTQGDIKEIANVLAQYQTKELEKIPEVFEELQKKANGAKPSIEGVTGAIKEGTRELQELKRAEQEVENLKNQVLDFFSITNTIQIFKNAVRYAFNTVKKLDAAMTETAVVTNFSIGDMWDKLPEYSAQASQLGTSIKSLYEATTLYYQQGLNTEQAMGVGIETMKMARVANMDAAAATEAMTAALRGFNMEINETSAIRISDVYSELAAITASDTEQIATAMSKTASIAASANMEFETTAALLAQIIETTQEAPETAGTAMKTIIARFTEVKQLFSEGMLTGEDSEGEEININKIDAALKTVGISLKDFLNGTKGIDDIFLELASKWDSLDLATQRYIATMAAGSRQQSRFIAMMSNYERTMELVSAANNSAGASQEQFDKTLKSLEAKIQKLQNAWAEFTMGLANNEVIKAFVDILTWLLKAVNEITGIAGNDGLGGVITAFVRLVTVIASLRGAQSILRKLSGSILSQAGFAEKAAGAFLKTGKEIGTMGVQAGKTFKIFTAFFSKFSGWIGLLVGLGLAISAVVKGYQAAQKSQKMEDLNSSMKEFENSANEAKIVLEEMGREQDSLNGLQNKLKQLTKETKEWNQALIDTNQQVFDLIDKYSHFDIQGYVSKGEYGQLVVDDSFWTNLQNKQQEIILNLQNQKKLTEVQMSELQQTMDFDDFVIDSKETDFQKKEAEILIGLNDFFDSKAFGKFTWGDLLLTSSQAAAERHRKAEGTGGYAVNYQKEQTGGLTSQEYTELAAALMREGITARDGYNNEELKRFAEIYGSLEYSAENMDEVIKKILSLGQKFDELGNIVQEDIMAEEQVAKKYVRNAVTGVLPATTSEEIDQVEAISNLITEIRNYDNALNSKIQQEKQDILNKVANKEDKYNEMDLKLEYAKLFGYAMSHGKIYTDSTFTQEVQADNEAMAEAIANANITVKVQEDAVTFAEKLATRKESQRELFSDIFSDEGNKITAQEQNKFYKDGLLSLEDIAKELGYQVEGKGTAHEKSAFEVMAEDLDYTIIDLQKLIEENFEKASERTKKQRQATAQNIGQYRTGNLTNKDLYDTIKGIEDKFSSDMSDIQVREILDSAINSLSKTGDNRLIQSGIFRLMQEGIDGTAKSFEELSEFIGGINWYDPVNAFQQLNKEAKLGSGATKEMAQSLLSLNSSFLGEGSQLRSLFNSEDYKEIQEGLYEILETQEAITATNINDLASKYSYLNKVLKNTGMSSHSLAQVLNSMIEGDMVFEDINDALISGIKNLGAFESSLDEVLRKAQEFNPGRDEGEVQNLVDEAAEVVSEKMEVYQYNNTEAKSYVTELLGEDYLNVTPEEQEAKMQQANQWLQKISGSPNAMLRIFEYIAEGKDVMGNALEKGPADISGIQYGYTEQGKFFVDIDPEQYSTLEDVYKAFADSGLGGSETLWGSLFTLLSSVDSGFMYDWNLEQASLTGQRMKEEALQIDGNAIVSKKTIEQTAEFLHKEYGKITDKSMEDYAKEIREGLGESFIEFSALDENGVKKELEVIKAEIDNIFGGEENLLGKYIMSDEEGIQTFDFNGLASSFELLGLTAQESVQMAYDYIANLSAEVEKINIDGHEIELFNTDGTQKDIEVIKEEVENLKSAAEVESTINVNTAAATQKVRAFIEELNKIKEVITVKIKVEDEEDDEDKGKETPGVGRAALNVAGETLTTNATGVKNSPTSGWSLTGEEGPELVWTGDSAYLVGTEGPQMAYINRGDTVYTAEETREIYKRQGTNINSYSGGYNTNGVITTTVDLNKVITGGSGGKSKEEEAWENSFDKLYNLVHKIDEELRQRERIERRYEKLLESIDASANSIIDVSREQLAQLEKERMLQEQLIAGRKYQIEQYQSENADLAQYAAFAENERGEQVLRIDWEAIDAITDEEQGSRVEEYVSQLEEWNDALLEAEDALWEIEDAVQEIKERGKDEYFELEDAIKEAVVQSYQDQIDKLSEINNSINDTNSSLLDAIQKSIDLQRQERENQRTEEDLAKKQRKLLYLQQDTSNANDMEIMQLQKELEEGQEDYTDTLIDQKISELQDQNEEAAKQREQQITLLQSQLDHYIETGAVWNEVYDLMESGLDKETGLVRGSRLEELLKSSEGFEGMSQLARMEWMNDTNSMIAQGLAYLETGRQLEDLGIEEGSQIEFTTEDGRVLTGTVDEDGNVKASNGKVYNNVYQGADGKYYAGSDIEEVETPVVESIRPSGGETTQQASKYTEDNIIGIAEAIWLRGSDATGWGAGDIRKSRVDEKIGAGAGQEVQTRINKIANKSVGTGKAQKDLTEYYYGKFKQGGLADFTGPAWLDGTKSRPEVVLDAQDSRNFIQLRDILSSVLNNGSFSNTSTENNGDITYDIDINVESIGSDYDVEQVANKIKSLIGEDARYRNNNSVSLMR